MRTTDKQRKCWVSFRSKLKEEKIRKQGGLLPKYHNVCFTWCVFVLKLVSEGDQSFFFNTEVLALWLFQCSKNSRFGTMYICYLYPNFIFCTFASSPLRSVWDWYKLCQCVFWHMEVWKYLFFTQIAVSHWCCVVVTNVLSVEDACWLDIMWRESWNRWSEGGEAAVTGTCWFYRRRVEAEVWASHQRDWIHQEETSAGVWGQTGGGAAEQTAAGEEGETFHWCSPALEIYCCSDFHVIHCVLQLEDMDCRISF